MVKEKDKQAKRIFIQRVRALARKMDEKAAYEAWSAPREHFRGKPLFKSFKAYKRAKTALLK
jgi:hypothetical protein